MPHTTHTNLVAVTRSTIPKSLPQRWLMLRLISTHTVEDRLKQTTEEKTLFTIRWTLN
jgi:hypothetical protein